MVPSVVLAECLTGRQSIDALTNRFLKGCDIEEQLPEQIARNAGRLRHRTGRASEISAVDAVVIAMAEPDGIVLSTDPEDLGALAVHALLQDHVQHTFELFVSHDFVLARADSRGADGAAEPVSAGSCGVMRPYLSTSGGGTRGRGTL